VDHPLAGELTYPGPPFRLSATPGRPGRAPLLGEHNEEILQGVLGLTRADLDVLTGEGVTS
jgi:crotonobetainyl-CoA:carnitine CoA-transferase CaiB-like acyl-CoA transferase